MYSALQRLNNIFAFATTVFFVLLALITTTSYIRQPNLSPATVNVSNLNVVFGRVQSDYRSGEKEYAYLNFDIEADLSPLFDWNTKQVFCYLVAEYASEEYPRNEVVVWDKIVQSNKPYKISIAGKNKYNFKDITSRFDNRNVTFSLQYNSMPNVGLLSYGTHGRTELPMQFPSPKTLHR